MKRKKGVSNMLTLANVGGFGSGPATYVSWGNGRLLYVIFRDTFVVTILLSALALLIPFFTSCIPGSFKDIKLKWKLVGRKLYTYTSRARNSFKRRGGEARGTETEENIAMIVQPRHRERPIIETFHTAKSQ